MTTACNFPVLHFHRPSWGLIVVDLYLIRQYTGAFAGNWVNHIWDFLTGVLRVVVGGA